MKKIEAIIRPEDLDKVRLLLQEIGAIGMTIEDVQGRGRLVIDNKDVEPAIAEIIKVARKGNIGDGKIFVYPIEQTIRISTGERGKDAI